MRAAALALAALLAACAAPAPFVDSSGAEPSDAVRAECKFEVEKALVNSRPIDRDLDRINLTAYCLNSKGYFKGGKPAA